MKLITVSILSTVLIFDYILHKNASKTRVCEGKLMRDLKSVTKTCLQFVKKYHGIENEHKAIFFGVILKSLDLL